MTDEVIARQMPETQSIIRLLLAEMVAREQRVMASIAEWEVQAAALKQTNAEPFAAALDAASA